jgi:hypothetical protein
MSIRIEITSTPYRLDALEELCAVARRQGFPDDATVKTSGSDLTVRCNSEDVAEASR